MVEFSINSLRESLMDYFRYFPQSWTISLSIIFGTTCLLLSIVFILLRVGILKRSVDFHLRLPFALFIASLTCSILLILLTVQGSIYESWIIIGDFQSTLLFSLLISSACLVYAFWLLAFRSKQDKSILNYFCPSQRIYHATSEQQRRKLKILRISSFALLIPLLFLIGGGKKKFIYSFIIDNSVSMQAYGSQVTESILHINEKTQGDFDLVFSFFRNITATDDDYLKVEDLAIEKNPDLISLSQTQYFEHSKELSDFLYDLDNNLYNYKVPHTPLLMTIKQNSLMCNDLFSNSDYSRKVLFLISDGFESNPYYAGVSENLKDPFNWKSPESSIYEKFDEIILIRVNPETVPQSGFLSVFDNISKYNELIGKKIVDINLDEDSNLSELLRNYTYKDFKDYNILFIIGIISIVSIVSLFLIKI